MHTIFSMMIFTMLRWVEVSIISLLEFTKSKCGGKCNPTFKKEKPKTYEKIWRDVITNLVFFRILIFVFNILQVAGDHKYHPECFTCCNCYNFIGDGETYALVERSKLYWYGFVCKQIILLKNLRLVTMSKGWSNVNACGFGVPKFPREARVCH